MKRNEKSNTEQWPLDLDRHNRIINLVLQICVSTLFITCKLNKSYSHLLFNGNTNCTRDLKLIYFKNELTLHLMIIWCFVTLFSTVFPIVMSISPTFHRTFFPESHIIIENWGYKIIRNIFSPCWPANGTWEVWTSK